VTTANTPRRPDIGFTMNLTNEATKKQEKDHYQYHRPTSLPFQGSPRSKMATSTSTPTPTAAAAAAAASTSTSSSSSLVAGLHGGNFYDLTTCDEDHILEQPRQQPRHQHQRQRHNQGVQSGRHRHRRHSAVMDDLRSYKGGRTTPSSITATNKFNNNSSNSKKCNPFVIDLVNESDGSNDDAEEEEEDDGIRKKRSLQRNNNKCGYYKTNTTIGPSSSSSSSSYSSPSNNSSPLSQKRTRRPLNDNINPTPNLNNNGSDDIDNNATTTNTTTGVHHLRMQQHSHEIVSNNNDNNNNNCQFLHLPPSKTRDGATITFGLLSLIDVLKDYGNDNTDTTLTCEGSAFSSRSKLFTTVKLPIINNTTNTTTSSSPSPNNPSPTLSSQPSQPPPPPSSSPLLPYNHQPFHYLQNDNWSCGFRNLQMLLSGMLPRLSPIFPGGVPSIAEIQSAMETLWLRGFDRTNAEHHGHSLIGKKTWIGTVEVWSYLSFHRIDSIIVQFIKTKENRAMVGNFVWAYFSRKCGSFGCSSCENHHDDNSNDSSSSCRDDDRHPPPLASPILHSYEYASHLLRGISSEPATTSCVEETTSLRGGTQCSCSLPPLYLQWEGHSVTIVGVRKNFYANKKNNDNNNGQQPPPSSYNLIIFCPQKQQLPALKNKLLSELTRRENNSNNNSNSSNDLADASNNNNHLSHNNDPSSTKYAKSVIELPASKLQNKDCQILLSTGRIIDEEESHRRKSCTKNVGFIDAVTAVLPRK